MKNIFVYIIANLLIINNLFAQYSDEQRGKDSLLSINLSTKIRDKYAFVDVFRYGWAKVRNHDCLWGLINEKGEEILSPNYKSMDFVRGILLSAQKDGKTQYWLRQKEKIVPLQYEHILTAGDEHLLVEAGGFWGVINTKGEGIVLLRYEAVVGSGEGYWKVKLGGLWGLLDKNGKTVFETKYDNIFSWKNGLFLITEKGKAALVNAKKEAVSAWYEGWGRFYPEADFIAVRTGEQWGLLGADGREIMPPKYAEIRVFSDFLMVARLPSTATHLLNKNGEKHIEDNLENWMFCRDVLAVKLWGKGWGVYDGNGKILAQAEYSDCKCNERSAYLELQKPDKQWGVMLTSGKWLLSPQAQKLKEGTAAYSLAANAEGKWAVSLAEQSPNYEYDDVLALDAQYTAVKKSSTWQVLNINTNQSTKNEFDDISKLNSGFFVVKQSDKFGVINSSGAIILPTKYQAIEQHDQGIFRVKISDSVKYLDAKGKECKCK